MIPLYVISPTMEPIPNYVWHSILMWMMKYLDEKFAVWKRYFCQLGWYNNQRLLGHQTKPFWDNCGRKICTSKRSWTLHVSTSKLFASLPFSSSLWYRYVTHPPCPTYPRTPFDLAYTPWRKKILWEGTMTNSPVWGAMYLAIFFPLFYSNRFWIEQTWRRFSISWWNSCK